MYINKILYNIYQLIKQDGPGKSSVAQYLRALQLFWLSHGAVDNKKGRTLFRIILKFFFNQGKYFLPGLFCPFQQDFALADHRIG